MRKVQLVEGEYYHIFNRGVDKRKIFSDEEDRKRFFVSMNQFNSISPIGSIYENSFQKRRTKKLGNLVSKLENKINDKKQEPLVEFVAYCLNPNHFHFLLMQSADRGIEKFMHRLGLGYTKYFNQKHKRSGSLFQGTFRAVHVDSDEQLLHLSAYINLNYKVHKLGNLVSKSSWDEYVGKPEESFCNPGIVMEQFTREEYKRFAESTVRNTVARRSLEEQYEK